MNAPNPLSLLGPAGNAVPAPLGQAPAGPESAFADSLSLALSGAVVPPIVPTPSPTTGALGLLADTPVEAGSTDFLLSGSSLDRAAPSPSFGGEAGDILPELTAAGIDPNAKELLPALQASASTNTNSAVSAAALNIASDQQGTDLSLVQPIVSSLPANGASQLKELVSEEGAGTAKVLLDAGDNRLPEQVLPQLRQNLTNRTERQLSNDTTGQVKESAQGSLAEFLQAAGPLQNEHGTDQRGQQPGPQSLLAQSGLEAVRGGEALSNAEHLAQTRVEAANLQSGGNNLELFKPATFAAIQNVSVTEAQRIDSRLDAGPIEIFATEPGRIDPVGSTNIKPQAQQPQPPAMQIALQVVRAAPQGIDRFSVQLHPAELGSVEIQLDFAEDGHVSALIVAERPETLDLLQRDSRSLERSLNESGLQMDSGGLSFSLKQNQDQQGQGFSAFSHHQPQAYRNGARLEGAGDSAPSQDPIRITQQRLLDIHT